MNKEIAQRLRILADNYPPIPKVLHTVETRKVIKFGGEVKEYYNKPIYKAEVILKLDGLTVKCLPFKECVLKVAAKYQKAQVYQTRGVSCKQPSKRKPKFSWRIVKEFLSEPHGLENAIAYMQLHNQTVYFANYGNGARLIVDIKKVEGDFLEQKNKVTHIPSGYHCSRCKTIDDVGDFIHGAIIMMSEDDLKFQERARIEHGCA